MVPPSELTLIQQRALDFARRLCFVGHEHLTDARRKRLWEDAEDFLLTCFDEGATGWEDDAYACDMFPERFEDRYIPNTAKWNKRYENGDEPRYYAMLHGICRAALDLVDDFRGMVWGWTIGDIKRMYDGKLPDWWPTDWVDWDGKPVAITDETGVAI